MERPADVFDREAEWTDLVEFAASPGGGMRLAVVSGRRRHGKSFLLRRLTDAAGGFYHQALDQERQQALAVFGADLGRYVGAPADLAFSSWADALTAVAALPATDRPALVVIDELPYLLQHSPELTSVLQRTIDDSRARQSPAVRLIICGSALSVMSGLLTGTQALRGRATSDLRLAEFDFRTAAEFWGIADPSVASTVHAIVGGTPGYRDLLPGHPPRGTSDIAEWLKRGVLNPASAMFREDEFLLGEERTLTDRALYHAVLGAIAAGRSTQTTIASAVGRENRAVQHPLRVLVDAGFVMRDEDVLRDRRPTYRIADPIVRFHQTITRRDLARFEDRRFDAAWADAGPRFAGHVLGPHFEDLARSFTRRFATADTVGGSVATVGSAVVNDAQQRAQHEIDVVVTSYAESGADLVAAIGEAKHSARLITMSALTRLERIRALLVERQQATPTTKLLIFAARGFDAELRVTAAGRDDVELIDIERIYRGS